MQTAVMIISHCLFLKILQMSAGVMLVAAVAPAWWARASGIALLAGVSLAVGVMEFSGVFITNLYENSEI